MEYKRVLAVGDIHGMYGKLVALLKQAKFNPTEDLMVFLGDYIDRGPEPLQCLSHVMELKKWYPKNVVCLKGNHEAMALDCALSCFNKYSGEIGYQEESIMTWLDNGGYNMMKAMTELPAKVLNLYLNWMRRLPFHYRYKNFYFCHAGVNPWRPIKEQEAKDLLWIREPFFESYAGKLTVVVGHTRTASRLFGPYLPEGADNSLPQFLDNNIILCDTGAYRVGGKLSCVDVLSKQFWQA